MSIPVDDPLAHAVDWLEAGRQVVLATVIETWGSAPRPVGSMLAANDQEHFAGSLSGGCIEAAVLQRALVMMRLGIPVFEESFRVSVEQAWGVGLACGGQISVLLTLLTRDTSVTLKTILSARARRLEAVLSTCLRTGERDVRIAEGHASAPLEGPTTSVILEQPQGAVFVQTFAVPLRVFIIGAVHLGERLAWLAAFHGFETLVIDPRAAFVRNWNCPSARIACCWPEESFERLALDRDCAVIAVSHDPKLDDPALVEGLRRNALYVGALGSRRTHLARLARLRERGVEDNASARIHGPVGLDIGASTPTEIATSIMAQLISVLHGRCP